MRSTHTNGIWLDNNRFARAAYSLFKRKYYRFLLMCAVCTLGEVLYRMVKASNEWKEWREFHLLWRFIRLLLVEKPICAIKRRQQHRTANLTPAGNIRLLIQSLSLSLSIHLSALNPFFLFIPRNVEVQNRRKNENRMQVNRKRLSWILMRIRKMYRNAAVQNTKSIKRIATGKETTEKKRKGLFWSTRG